MWKMWWRTCAYCKVSWGKIDFLCEECWTELEKNLQPTLRILPKSKLVLFSLWLWEHKDVRIQKLLLDLKGRQLHEARERLLLLFVDFLKQQPPPQTICCVVSRSHKDHGLAMAEGFAKHYQCSLLPLTLVKPSTNNKTNNKTNYKTLHRRERYAGRQVTVDPSLRGQLKGPIWFVDDVLTTGATALTVWEALGRPSDYRAVTMVYRAFH